MASIRKRGSNSYLIVVSRGYDYEGNRLKSVQKTVKPPKEYTPKQAEMSESYLMFGIGIGTCVACVAWYLVSWLAVPSNRVKNKLTLKFMVQSVLNNMS